jgi:hypothetical protein
MNHINITSETIVLTIRRKTAESERMHFLMVDYQPTFILPI